MPLRACCGAASRPVQGCREIGTFSAQAGRGDDGARRVAGEVPGGRVVGCVESMWGSGA